VAADPLVPSAVSDDSRAHWTEPGAWPVSPGVYRIPLPLPGDALRAVNVYAILAADGLVMIDGGWAVEPARAVLSSSLRSIDLGLSDIRRILVTHVHRDHYTLAGALQRDFGARVSLGRAERQSLDYLRNPVGESVFVTRLRRAGADSIAQEWRILGMEKKQDLSLWPMPEHWLDDGAQPVEGRSLQAVSTPGHTQGHTCFVDPDAGLLFSGDHVLPTITPSIAFEASHSELPLRRFLGSLERVLELPDSRLLPAHGPVAASSHGVANALLRHHGRRLLECRDAVSSGASTALEVARSLRWTRARRTFDELDTFNGALAVHEALLHLDLLAATGRLNTETLDACARFSVLVGTQLEDTEP
jgi:glyoxylase-like metal-dependent hydrolase (beta-lactamase superfamily II)